MSTYKQLAEKQKELIRHLTYHDRYLSPDFYNKKDELISEIKQIEEAIESSIAKTETDTGKIVNMPDVSCDWCGCHPSVIVRTPYGRYCQEHAQYIKKS